MQPCSYQRATSPHFKHQQLNGLHVQRDILVRWAVGIGNKFHHLTKQSKPHCKLDINHDLLKWPTLLVAAQNEWRVLPQQLLVQIATDAA